MNDRNNLDSNDSMRESGASDDPFAFLNQHVPGASEKTLVDRSLSDSKFGEIDLLGENDGTDIPFTSTDLDATGYDLPRNQAGSGTIVSKRTRISVTEEDDIVVPPVSLDVEEEPMMVVTSLNDVSERMESQQPSGAAAGHVDFQEEDYSMYPVYSIKRYRGYFNVGTGDVLYRILRSVLYFFKGDFLDHIGGNPDLYGPFWIASTLIFISAAAGNTASYIAHHKTEDQKGWYYDVDKVGGSMGLFYGYVGIIGFFCFAVLKYFKSSASLAMIWCIYGYALVSYIPMAALCVIPMESVRWALVGIATGVSGIFLIRSLQPCVADSQVGVKSTLVLATALGAHFVLGLSLKLYFFNY